MKRQLIALCGVVVMITAAASFNLYKTYSKKILVCYASKYYFGFNVEKMCRDPGMYQGSNYRVVFLYKDNKQHTVGNTYNSFYTWYMNK